MRRRVVVTGLGCVCPVGNTVRDSWEALLQGRSGVATISQFVVSGFPVRIAAEVKEFAREFPAIVARYPKSGRNLLFAVAAKKGHRIPNYHFGQVGDVDRRLIHRHPPDDRRS